MMWLCGVCVLASLGYAVFARISSQQKMKIAAELFKETRAHLDTTTSLHKRTEEHLRCTEHRLEKSWVADATYERQNEENNRLNFLCIGLKKYIRDRESKETAALVAELRDRAFYAEDALSRIEENNKDLFQRNEWLQHQFELMKDRLYHKG